MQVHGNSIQWICSFIRSDCESIYVLNIANATIPYVAMDVDKNGPNRAFDLELDTSKNGKII